MILPHLSWLVHNGKKAKFWEDRWNGYLVLSSFTNWGNLMDLLKNLWGSLVADYFNVEFIDSIPKISWKFVDDLDIPPSIKEAYKKEMDKRCIIFSPKDDVLIWTNSKSREYSVKEGYNSLLASLNKLDFPHILFWDEACLPKAGVFSWVAINGRDLIAEA